jgi:chorismate mutase
MGNGSRPALIAGPCSAETEEQVHLTVEKLALTGKVNMIRAGIWKPRTRPNSFEGVGEVGLTWLKNAGVKFNLPVMTEVANAHHVDLALKAGVDALWIGARTTVNPFTVQEIADSLKGLDIPVFIKNPVNPDLQLWIGAIERIINAGISKVAAIHRGFSYHGESVYRNEPMWEIPIKLRAIMPGLPVFCDPSHICGNRDLLALVSQRAMDMGMDGLMIETHPDPDKAWSDAAQQITPLGFDSLINSLEIREEQVLSQELKDRMTELRTKIDGLDSQILDLISARMGVAREIGQYKKEHGITILQLERWMEIVKTRSFRGEKLGLSDEFIEHYLEQLHRESILHQTRVMNGKSGDDGVMW